jgi:hypothetical protein
MSEHNENKWREKLNRLPVADESANWQRMQVLLDTEQDRRKRRWLYFALAAIALIAVVGLCNYNVLTKSESAGTKKHSEANTPIDHQKEKANSAHPDSSRSFKNLSNAKQRNRDQIATTQLSNTSSANSNTETHRLSPVTTSELTKSSARRQKKIPSSNSRTDISIDVNTDSATDQATIKSDAVAKEVNVALPDTTAKEVSKKLLDSPSVQSNSLKQQRKTKKQRFEIAVGLNYFIPIDGQQKSNSNRRGSSNFASNFFPVISGKYYFDSSLFIQAEMQLVAPQYANNTLIDRTTKFEPGPMPASLRRIVTTVSTDKLFYLDVPVSLNYKVKTFSFGAGVQYSRLAAAIGTYDVRLLQSGRPDSLISFERKRVDDTLTSRRFRENEFRYFINAGFRIKKLEFGLRYTRALKPYLQTPFTDPENKLINKSVALFVRYNLFGN